MTVFRSGAIYVAANVISAAIPLLLLPFLTRVLDPVEYGKIVGFALLVTLCQPIAGLNLHGALGVLWFREPAREIPAYVGTALALITATTLATALVAATALHFVPAGVVEANSVWVFLAALTSGANIVLQCRLALLRNQSRAFAASALQIFASALNLAISLFAVIELGWGGEGRNTGILASALVGAGLAAIGFWRSQLMEWRPTRQQLRFFVTFGAPLIVHGLAAVLLATADRWSISIQLEPAALGLYGTGAQLGAVMAILSDAFVKAYGPWMQSSLASDDPVAPDMVVGAIYVGIPGFLLLGLIVGSILIPASAWILGREFRDAADVIPWFLLGGAFNGVYVCTSVLFFYWSKTGHLAVITTISGLSGSVIVWVLTSAFGVTGAAAGYAASQGLLALLTTVVAMRNFDLPWGRPRRSLKIWSNKMVRTLRGSIN